MIELADKVANYEPESEFQLLMATLLESNCKRSLVELCIELGVCRKTLYARLKSDLEFADWWNDELESWAITHKHSVYTNLISGASRKFRKGDKQPVAANIRLFMERFDKRYRPRTSGDSPTTNVQVNIGGELGALVDAALASSGTLEMAFPTARRITAQIVETAENEAKGAEMDRLEAPGDTISDAVDTQDHPPRSPGPGPGGTALARLSAKGQP